MSSLTTDQLARLRELSHEPMLPLAGDRPLLKMVADELDPIYTELPPIFYNQSRWKSYQDCDRLYGWINVENLRPHRKKAHFEVGTAVHKAQFEIFKHGGTDEAIKLGVEAAVDSFTTGMGHPQLPGDDEEIADGLNTIKRMLPAYYRHYAQQGTLWKPLGMELKFCVEVGEGTNVFLVGRIDNLATFMSGLWIVDTKTMKRLDMRTFMQFEIDIQLTAYIYGGSKQLTIDALARGDKPVMIRGAIIDGMVKTLIPKFHREMYTREIAELREFELEFCMKTWEIAAKHAIVAGNRKLYNAYRDRMYDLGASTSWKTVFPKNTQKCFNYGTCAFRELCVKDSDVRRLLYEKRDRDYVDAERATRPLVPDTGYPTPEPPATPEVP